MAFNGERLRKARIFRNLSISDVAESTGVSRQAISQFEKNQSAPKPELLFQLISVLKFPLAFFTEESQMNEATTENTFFRAQASAKTLDLDTQKLKTEIVFDLYNYLNTYLTFPKLDLPKKDLSNESPEFIAEHLRAYWSLGCNPISNLVSLLEKKGIIVSSFKTKTMNIDAFTQIRINNGVKNFCVVLGNDKKSMVRRNFDAAHELGHIMMHNGLPDISELEKDEFKAMETEANQFAAAFLLPRDAFYFDLTEPTKLETYVELKKKWKVSIAAMIMRARQIERISPTQFQNLMKQLSFKQWRKSEPFDNDWQVAKPQLFKQSINILVENKILSPLEIVNEFGKYGYHLNAIDIEDLMDLDRGVLSETDIPENSNLVLSLKDYKS